MGAGRRMIKVSSCRNFFRLSYSLAKVIFVASIVVFLWEVMFLLSGDQKHTILRNQHRKITAPETKYGKDTKYGEDTKDTQDTQKEIVAFDVSLPNAQVLSSDATLGSAVISLFEEESLKVASISITTSISINTNNNKKVTVNKSKNHLSIIATEAILNITKITIEEMLCLNIIEESIYEGYFPSHSIDIGLAKFYGGGEMINQKWPLNNDEIITAPFVPSDKSHTSGFGPVLERYWLTSEGQAIFADHKVPLHVGYGESWIILQADNSNLNQDVIGEEGQTMKVVLNYTICLGPDIKTTHMKILGKLWSFPVTIPDIPTFKYPIWWTKIRYGKNVNKEDVLTLVNEIVTHKFTASQLQLDELYTTNSGDNQWDETKFPDVDRIIKNVHKNIPTISVVITPFINEYSPTYRIAKQKEYFIENDEGKIANIMISPGTNVGHIDFTSKAAVQFFMQTLSNLTKSGVDSFVMDGGQIYHLPPNFQTSEPLTNPMGLCTHLVQAMRKGTNNKLVVKCGYQTQFIDAFIQTLPKESTWEFDGLKAVIPTVLQYGIVGYLFFVPSVIGGVGFNPEEGTILSGHLPDSELFIRWSQLAAFLPVMQFSITPWDYTEETISIVQKFVTLHKEYVAPKIIALASKATKTGYPIIRPLWWSTPTDLTTYEIDSQFLIGDDVLVAPILTKGATYRSVYLPEGKWKDMNYNKTFRGPQMLQKYFAPLHKIPYFERLQRKSVTADEEE